MTSPSALWLDTAATLTRDAFGAVLAVPTRWSDQDVYGHVNNAVHYELIDTAVNRWLIESTGSHVRDLPALGVVVETGCRFLAELSFPATVDVGLAALHVGRTSVRYGLALFASAEHPIAVAHFAHVYVDPHTRRPLGVPDVVRAATKAIAR